MANNQRTIAALTALEAPNQGPFHFGIFGVGFDVPSNLISAATLAASGGSLSPQQSAVIFPTNAAAAIANANRPLTIAGIPIVFLAVGLFVILLVKK